MNIIELRDKLNWFIEHGYGEVNCIGERFTEYFDDAETGSEKVYEWRYLEDVELCDRDGHGGAGMRLKFDDYENN